MGVEVVVPCKGFVGLSMSQRAKPTEMPETAHSRREDISEDPTGGCAASCKDFTAGCADYGKPPEAAELAHRLPHGPKRGNWQPRPPGAHPDIFVHADTPIVASTLMEALQLVLTLDARLRSHY